MRAAISSIVVCLALLSSGSALAWNDYSYNSNSCSGGSCGEGACNPYESNCQCTDPMCNRPAYSDCISRAYCCEAFGNIGAR